MNLTLAEIAEAVKAARPGGAEPVARDESAGQSNRLIRRAADVRATGVTWDSRDVVPGDLYVALPGERVDGHDFVDAAADAGAVAVLASHPVEAVVPVIVVDDTAAAFSDLARYWRTRLTSTVIGLTGSSGKTTTKNLVRDVLSHDLNVVATKANQNNELGVPRTLLAADAETQAIVVEMGMRGAGQIAELAEIAQPNWALITNVGASHIELLGSREAIAHAKAELYEALPDGGGLAFVNADDEYAAEMCAHARLEERGVQIVYYGVEAPLARGGELSSASPLVWASDIALDDAARPTFTLNAVGFEQMELPEANGSRSCTLALNGLHNVSNACAAAAVGLASGMTLDACCDALEGARPTAGRSQVHHTAAGITVVDDAYNANPDSMAASLSTFAAMGVSGKRVAVLGDMLELGDYAGVSHQRVGELAAASGLDLLVCVGPLSRLAAEEARNAGMGADAVFTCDDAAAAFDLVESRLVAGDAVLVKASHSVGLERVVEGLVD